MTKMISLAAVIALAISVYAVLPMADSALACGGFFCQNSPVDQNAERIIFTQNKDGTVSAYIQIQYTGSAPGFSWILPLPEAIGPEDIEVPEDAMAAFTELEVATDPVFIRPELPDCARLQMSRAAVPSAVQADGVQVFASGEVGPYGFDVIGSEDPDALVEWLRENGYRVTEEMEPLINIYVEERFVFLAMRLQPGQGAQDVQPVKVTYPSERPMIPLRLTAVAANADMAVMTWFYADNQAVPVNYAKMEIADEDLTFSTFGGGSNYRQLMGTRADEFGGHAFITEYAAPTHQLRVSHPLLRELGNRYAYITRLNTVISPMEMTVDPIFDYDPQLKDVSNIHDLSASSGLFDCERSAGSNVTIRQPVVIGNTEDSEGSNPQSVSLTLGVSNVSGTLDEIKQLMSDLGAVVDQSDLSIREGGDSAFLSFRVDQDEFRLALKTIENQGKLQVKELRESSEPPDGENRVLGGPDARFEVSLVEDTSSNAGLIAAIAAPSAIAFIALLAALFYLTYRAGSHRRARNQ